MPALERADRRLPAGRTLSRWSVAAAAALLLLPIDTSAQKLTDPKIPFASTPFAGSELFYCVQNGKSCKTTFDVLRGQGQGMKGPLYFFEPPYPPPSNPQYMGGYVEGVLTSSGSTPLPIMPFDDTTSPFFGIAIRSDTAIPTAATSGLTVAHHFGGGTDPTGYCTVTTPSIHQCSHFGIWVNLIQDQPTPAGVEFNTGIFSNVIIKAAAAGTGAQSEYAYAAQMSDNVGGHYGITAAEFDIAMTATGNNIKEGLGIFSAPLAFGNDKYQGSAYSAGLGITASGNCGTGTGAGGSGCAGFSLGISFGRSESYIGVAPGGTLIQTTQGVGTSANMVVANGINFGNLKATANYLNMGGMYAVSAAGDPTISTPFPAFVMNDTHATPTTGGLTRLAGFVGNYALQINTAPAADFSTVTSGFVIDTAGRMNLPVVAQGMAANSPLCITTNTGLLYHATGGAC